MQVVKALGGPFKMYVTHPCPQCSLRMHPASETAHAREVDVKLEFEVNLGSIVRLCFEKPRPASKWMLWSVHLVE